MCRDNERYFNNNSKRKIGSFSPDGLKCIIKKNIGEEKIALSIYFFYCACALCVCTVCDARKSLKTHTREKCLMVLILGLREINLAV